MKNLSHWQDKIHSIKNQKFSTKTADSKTKSRVSYVFLMTIFIDQIFVTPRRKVGYEGWRKCLLSCLSFVVTTILTKYHFFIWTKNLEEYLRIIIFEYFGKVRCEEMWRRENPGIVLKLKIPSWNWKTVQSKQKFRRCNWKKSKLRSTIRTYR